MKAKGFNSVNSWIATFACAFIGFLIIIPIRLSGLIFVIIVDEFQTSRKLAALPIVLFSIIRTLGGPFTGHLGETFGLRIIICIGTVFVAVGVGGCFFAEDVVTIIIFLGLIYGIGLAFANSLIHSIVRQHFNKNVNLANGLVLSGNALGATLFTPVIKYLINFYGTSGMFLILSGILLNALPTSIILKDPKNEIWDLDPTQVIVSQKFKNNGGEKIELSARKKYVKETTETENNVQNSYDGTAQNISSLIHSDKRDDNCKAADNDLLTQSGNDVSENNTARQRYEQNPLNENVTRSDHPVWIKGKSKSHPGMFKSKSKSCLSNFELFLDPTFLLQMCLQSIHGFNTVLTWTIIVDYGRDKGIQTEQGLYFLMFLPVAEILGNLSLNWITDRGFLSRTNFCIICFFASAVFSGLILWASSFALMMAACMIFGYLSGALKSAFPGVIMEFIDKDNQNMALASRHTLFGVFGLLKSFLIGFFRDNLGSYDGIYYFIIACYILCVIFSFLTPISASRKRLL